jgi:hypothetical protein
VAKGKELEITEEERERRRKLAQELHKKGKFGGAQPGAGRKRKPRAQERVAADIAKRHREIIAALDDALTNGNAPTRLKAALAMLDIESKEHELQRKDEEHKYNNMAREQILELVRERLKQLEDQGLSVTDIIEGKARAVVEEPVLIESG